MSGQPRLIHTTRHSCDLACRGDELDFYLTHPDRPYGWQAFDKNGTYATGGARTKWGLRFSVGWCARKWVHAAHRQEGTAKP